MNYRHAFHAGGFADCVKHALLVWLMGALTRKAAPLFVLDTHAGAGAYDLGAGPAERTGEWRGGIGRLLEETPATLAEYVGLVRRLGLYPGSPALVRALLRPGDRMACCELHPEEYAALRRRFAHDPQVGVHHRDAWEALSGLLPPAERRGLVLIDPPFEMPDEFGRLLAGVRAAYARFRTGVFAAWYPIKHRAPIRAFLTGMGESGISDVITAEIWLREPVDPARLNGCGLLVINPPFRFAEAAPAILAALLDRLGGREAGEGTALIRLANE